jgi:hypothetical protein
MSLRTNRVLLPINAVSRNVLQKPLLARSPVDDIRIYEEPEYYEDDMPEMEVGHIQIIHKSESEELTINELIERLELIAEEELGNGIGLRKKTISKENLAIGNRAKMLVRELSRNPNKKTIAQAVEFIGIISFIEELEKIERERTRKIGLKVNEMPDEDKIFGESASELRKTLIFNPSKQNIKLAVKFLELAELIFELEDISSGRIKQSMGFIVPKIEDKDLKLSEAAKSLADVLKVSPTKQNVQTAVNFIELINLLDSGQAEIEIEEEKTTKAKSKQRANAAEPDYLVAA